MRIFQCSNDPKMDPQSVPTLSSYVGLAGLDPGALDLPRASPRAGVFGYDRGVTLEEMSSTLSTLAVVETARDNGPWLQSGRPTARGVDPDSEKYVGPGRAFGGLHPGGMNALYADGHVGQVSELIDPKVFREEVLLHKPAER
jgi:prepilin-type processing-associated H-X9-DG protein